jgi:8-oxo-dGTP pyrophosphatase MutT (NUDIX family)
MFSDTEPTCSNCGRSGHYFHRCKYPITSVGIIVFRKNLKKIEYLLIRRKNTIGYIEFIRGKYPLNNKEYIKNIIAEMTNEEKEKLLTLEFNELWNDIWGTNIGIQYRVEEISARDKFNFLKKGLTINNNFYCLKTIMNEISILINWNEQEWGFPKGRHNFQEKDLCCALREFEEETGYLKTDVKIIQNLIPIEEIFTGSNYKSYKHKYFVGFMDFENNNYIPNQDIIINNSEVSMMEWKDYSQALSSIRPYNLEKKNCLKQVNNIINNYLIC